MRFVFDIDGTLCFDGRLIDQTIIDTLLQLQHDGHELIFASARPITCLNMHRGVLLHSYH